jgi:hypothetical protein
MPSATLTGRNYGPATRQVLGLHTADFLPGSVRRRIKPAVAGSWEPVARARSVAGYAIPGIIVFFFWVVVVILAIILLAFIVHWAGGGVLNLRLGHFILNVGFT